MFFLLTEEGIICELKTSAISCAQTPGTTINITSANYGRTSRDICEHPYGLDRLHNDTNCRAPNSLSVVKTRCQQRVSCTLTADASLFGEDPCFGIYKYLEVDFECVETGITRRRNYNQLQLKYRTLFGACFFFSESQHVSFRNTIFKINEPRREKTGFFHMRKQRRKSASRFVFAIQIAQSLFLPNPKYQASNHLLRLYSPVCVGPGRKPRKPVFSQRGSNFFIGLERADCSAIEFLLFEPRSEKNGLRGFDQVGHKPGCTATEDG